MRKILMMLLIAVALSSCTQRGCQRWEKHTQYSSRTYDVIMFSGGDTVFQDRFTGIINGEEGTDGFYYFKGDTLIEISGDYRIKSVD